MFQNLVNAEDAIRFAEKVRERGMRSWKQQFQRRNGRIEAAWQHTQSPPKHWHSIPYIRERWNMLVSGSADEDFRQYLIRQHLRSHPKAGALTALSMGCGTGSKEIRWAQTGIFARLDAFDLSPQRIAEAQKHAHEQGVAHICHFSVADAQTFAPEQPYDVLIAEGSLHHLAHLHRLIPRFASWLAPRGYFILNDFVGASRFQWTPTQQFHTQRLLQSLSPDYRRYFGTQRLKNHAYTPGKFSMWLNDPSEAVESAMILPLMKQHFSPLEIRGLGGCLAHLVFEGIAHHFITPDETALAFLKQVCNEEDRLIGAGELADDFVVGIFSPP